MFEPNQYTFDAEQWREFDEPVNIATDNLFFECVETINFQYDAAIDNYNEVQIDYCEIEIRLAGCDHLIVLKCSDHDTLRMLGFDFEKAWQDAPEDDKQYERSDYKEHNTHWGKP